MSMRPSSFNYARAASVAEAVEILSSNPGAKALAGGHSLIPPLNLRLSQPDTLVDIGRIAELRGISVKSGSVVIGALTTHNEIAHSSDVKQHAPALAQAASKIGDQQVRNWGTLGGNIAHADPASDPPVVLLAYGARIHITGAAGTRVVVASDFFVDLFTTALDSGELIHAIEIPSAAGKRSAYVKMSHPASRYSVVGVAVSLNMSGNTCTGAVVAIGGATPKATLSAGAAAALSGSALDAAALDAAAKALQQDISSDVMGDLFAPNHYRLEMAGVYLKRAVTAALA